MGIWGWQRNINFREDVATFRAVFVGMNGKIRAGSQRNRSYFLILCVLLFWCVCTNNWLVIMFFHYI